MYIKSDFIPETKPLVSNYIVIKDAKLFKDSKKALKNAGPIKAEEPLECFKHCTKVNDYRCNIVEYNHVEKLCKFFDLPKDEHTTLKFKFSNKELIGESFAASTIENLRKKDITKEECINMFNSNTKSIFYNYKQDGSNTECIVGLATVSNGNTFAINLDSFNNEIKYIGSNVKYQMGNTDMTGSSEDQKKGSVEGNKIPLLLVVFGIVGIIVICGLIYYGISMVKKYKELNSNNKKSINTRNKVSHKIKASDPYNKGFNGSKGSKNSTLNYPKKSHHSQLSESYNFSSYSLSNRSQHSTVSNIAPQIYDYNESFTYVNNSYSNSLSNNEQSNSILNNNLQDFYNNASLSYDVPNRSKSNYSANNYNYSNNNISTNFINYY